MLDPRNNVVITGGLVVDPEVVNTNIAKLRVAVDYAGNEKGGSTSGYFDVTYFLNGEENARNAKFVKSQIDEGKLKKGSQISLIGRLVQERWSAENDKKNSKVVIVAESISYVKGSGSSSSDSSAASASSANDNPNQAELPDSF